ncbi:MAG: universal stress protein [Chloroflexi bacterium]|nr:universal stress protein [Chloroflexota bacterium]
MAIEVDRRLSYRRILVPLDGSAMAEAALPHAIAQARAFGAALRIVRVVPALPSVSGVPAGVLPVDLPGEAGLPSSVLPATALDGSPDDDAAVGATIYLEDTRRRLETAGATGITVETALRAGPVAATLLAEAAACGAGLIVIATHARSSFSRLVLGSVADELVRNAPCPVVLVRAAPLPEVAPIHGVRSFAEDLAAAGPTMPVSLGIREVPVDRIVGSVGRAHELDAEFRPRSADRRADPRFQRIEEALTAGKALPPLQLYKLGYDYYVLDGHHRVAVARALGIGELEAEVAEYILASDADQQRVFAERRDFERATKLTRVGASRPGTYPILLEMIREYAGTHGTHGILQANGATAHTGSDGRSSTAAYAGDADVEAARRWYVQFFQPMAQRIRSRRLGHSFPGERTADILMRLRDFRREEARLGHEVAWDAALEHFVIAYGRRQPRRRWDLRRLVPLGKR